MTLGTPAEKVQRLAHRQAEDFVDILVAIAHFQNAALEARAAAFLADQFDVGEKLHLDGDRAVALAGLAAPAGDIEGKVAGAEAALLGLAAWRRRARGWRRTP